MKVWFKPGRFDFETSIDTIRDDLARAGVATKAVEWLGNGELKYDKGLPRAEAEARAFVCCVAEWLNRNPARSPPGRCLGCGEAEHAHDPLLPFGTEPTGLHRKRRPSV